MAPKSGSKPDKQSSNSQQGRSIETEERRSSSASDTCIITFGSNPVLTEVKTGLIEAILPKTDKSKDNVLYIRKKQKTNALLSALSFQELCATAGQQQSVFFNTQDGHTRTLGILLTKFKERFQALDQDTKNRLGLSARAAHEITHFDLLEIGLYGKVCTDGKTPGEILIRNENLKHFYLKEHRGHHEQISLVEMIQRYHRVELGSDNEKNRVIEELNQVNLYSAILIIRNTKAEIETGSILNKVWSDEYISARRVEKKTKSTGDFFKEKMLKALNQYDKAASHSMIRFFSEQIIPEEMKALCSTVRQHLQKDEHHEAMAAITAQKNMDSSLKSYLKDQGFLSERGDFAVIATVKTRAQEAGRTVSINSRE